MNFYIDMVSGRPYKGRSSGWQGAVPATCGRLGMGNFFVLTAAGGPAPGRRCRRLVSSRFAALVGSDEWQYRDPGGDRMVLEPPTLGPQGSKTKDPEASLCCSRCLRLPRSPVGTEASIGWTRSVRSPVTRRIRLRRLARDRPVLCVAAGWEAGTTSHREPDARRSG